MRGSGGRTRRCPWGWSAIGAVGADDANALRHHFRLGYGTSFTMWFVMGFADHSRIDYHGYTGPITVDYHYRVNRWLMVGGKVTGAANWYTPKGYSDPSYRIDGSTGYWWVMPSVRFTYFNREKVRLFSSVAFTRTLSFHRICWRATSVAMQLFLVCR